MKPAILLIFLISCTTLSRFSKENKILYPVRVGDKLGYIDSEGQLIVRPKYTIADAFYNGYAIVSPDADPAMHPVSGKFYALTVDGEEIEMDDYTQQFNFDSYGTFYANGMLYIEGYRKLTNLSGDSFYISARKLDFSKADILPVQLINFNSKSNWTYGRVVFIDKDYSIAIADTFDYASDFNNGLSIVEKQKRYGVIEQSGNYRITPQYKWLTPFSNGLAIASKNNRQYGVISEAGLVIVPFHYQYIQPTNDSVFTVQKNNRYGFITSKNELVIQFQYQSANTFKKGIALVSTSDTSYFFINFKNENVFKQVFRYATNFQGELAFVEKKDEQKHYNAYINRSGKIVWRSNE
ncbi:MAG: WG repeat-containing protein [Calditrichaeota bacterium]|nr:WG repeat-containing protein [Calditrichota bacterium]